MDEMSEEDQIKMIWKMSRRELLEEMQEAQFYGYTLEEYLNLRKRELERE